jgi:NAD(P)-dependent dehydrogenase (short-subunit alcohol dehydrogenase family)
MLYQIPMQGIGRATALLFSKEGAKVVISECVLAILVYP